MAQTINTRMVYINNGEHDNPHELPKENSEGSLNTDNAVYTHTNLAIKLPEGIEKLEYIYQHYQDCEKICEIDPQVPIEHIDDTLYPQVNNDIECSLFENIIDSYYLDSQIRDDFTLPKLVMHIITPTTYFKTDKLMEKTPQHNTGIHFHSKHKYRDTLGDAHIQYYDFDNGDAFTYKDKYTALLQHELQNPYWCLHDPATTKSYQI